MRSRRPSAAGPRTGPHHIHSRRPVNRGRLVAHPDNGRPMKDSTIRATLQLLGLIPSFFRPRFGGATPNSGALFKS